MLQRTSSPSFSSPVETSVYRHLALRVIHQAIRDAHDGSASDRKSAEAFLRGSPMLRFWCELAGVDLRAVVTRRTTPLRHVGAPVDWR
jgi:hypothetical protein